MEGEEEEKTGTRDHHDIAAAALHPKIEQVAVAGKLRNTTTTTNQPIEAKEYPPVSVSTRATHNDASASSAAAAAA